MPAKNHPLPPADPRPRAIVTPLPADLRSLIDASCASMPATVNNEDFYIDLLFYNRRLRRLVAV
jgi:hypothetical protein